MLGVWRHYADRSAHLHQVWTETVRSNADQKHCPMACYPGNDHSLALIYSSYWTITNYSGFSSYLALCASRCAYYGPNATRHLHLVPKSLMLILSLSPEVTAEPKVSKRTRPAIAFIQPNRTIGQLKRINVNQTAQPFVCSEPLRLNFNLYTLLVSICKTISQDVI